MDRDIHLSDDLDDLRDLVRRFVAEHMPLEAAEDWDRENAFPRDVYDKLVALGVTGLMVPEEHGGSGPTVLGTLMVVEELAKRSMAVAAPFVMSACYAGMTLAECGSEQQQKELLPQVAERGLMFAYGWTEPDAAADLASVKTTVRREGDELVVNGSKRFCTGAHVSDYIYTLARSGPAEDRYRNLSFVLIPPDTPGVFIEKVDAMGLKGAYTTDVTFTDVRVPVENLMGGEEGWNQGWRMITGTGLEVEKLEVAAMALGIAAGAYAEAWEYARERTQFGKVISQYQSIRHKLADMQTALHASRVLLYHTARQADAGALSRVDTSITKLFVAEQAKSIVLEAQTILGAYGYVKGFACERFVRDVLVMPIFGGSSAIQRNNIAKASGLDA